MRTGTRRGVGVGLVDEYAGLPCRERVRDVAGLRPAARGVSRHAVTVIIVEQGVAVEVDGEGRAGVRKHTSRRRPRSIQITPPRGNTQYRARRLSLDYEEEPGGRGAVNARRREKGAKPDDADRDPRRRTTGPVKRKKGSGRTDEKPEPVGDDPEPAETEPTADAPPGDAKETDTERPERTRPYPNVRFLLEIDGIPEAGFSGCRVGGSATEPLCYREGNQPLDYRQIPGTTTYDPVRLERGVGDATALSGWRRLVEQGRMAEARRTVAVVLLSEDGEPGPRWELRAAWPARYEAPTLDARDGDVAIEALELVHEGIERATAE